MTNSQAPTSPPPASEVIGVLDTLDANQGDRITLVPIGPSLVFAIERKTLHEGGLMEVTMGEMSVELEFPIDLDPLDPSVHMAWSFVLSVFDPFQDAEPPAKWADVVNRMVDDALVEDYGTLYA
jgi:hypothetical protein